MNMICVPVGPLQANCYLVWDDQRHACAVDPGGESERLTDIISGRSLGLEAIFVTHGHFDHAEGVAGLSGSTGARVYCSESVLAVLRGEQGCAATGLPIPALAGAAGASMVSDGDTVEVGALTIKVIATPGHTPADLTYDIGGSLFCGDLLFRGSVGRTDFPGGDFGVLLASVSRLLEAYPVETKVYPGHMQSTTLGHELQQNPFLVELGPHG